MDDGGGHQYYDFSEEDFVTVVHDVSSSVSGTASSSTRPQRFVIRVWNGVEFDARQPMAWLPQRLLHDPHRCLSRGSYGHHVGDITGIITRNRETCSAFSKRSAHVYWGDTERAAQRRISEQVCGAIMLVIILGNVVFIDKISIFDKIK